MEHCNQCGSAWKSRIKSPVQCPRCKRYDWRQPKKGVRMIHLSEVASLSTEEIEAMQKPKGPSIMAEGFPISIPAMPKKKSGNGAFPHKMACPRCEKTESIRPWGSMHRCIECGVNF